jgi:hypothetical protein
MSKTSKSSKAASSAPVILEGGDPASLHAHALKLASGWIWDERKVLAGIHVDVSVLDNGAGTLIKTDEIRAIRRGSMLRPFDGEVKVYIIAHAHNMNQSAQNALLRILEEPPRYVRFILLTRNAAALLPTVRSRCVITRLPPGGQEERGHAGRAEAFADALEDPWRRMSEAYSWDKLPRASLTALLGEILLVLRDRCVSGGIKPVYTETIGAVSKLLPALELNASVGSVCGVLAIPPTKEK